MTPINVTYGPVVSCEFVPTEVGPYIINYEYCSKPAAEKPTIIKSFDPSKVIINPAVNGCVGKPVQFLVDATYAGEGMIQESMFATT